MAYRWHPRNAEVDSENPRAWATCDRCGFVTNHHKLQWQYDYNGSSTLQNLRLLVCSRCYDVPQIQLSPNILPPDPLPIYNARPEPYTLDEASWLATQDGDPLMTQDEEYLTPQIPSPDSSQSIADQASVHLVTEDDEEIVTEAGDGNPLDYEPNP